MSLTIANLLNLPCLREASVVGGRGGLTQTVNSISVMEGTIADEMQEYILNNIELLGNELVIACFVNIKDDVNAQCITMRRLAEVGEIGLILYYVGIVLPRVDPRLIELADSLDFPLICMPENQPNLRYSEVISEVMLAVFKDQMTDTHFQAEILERLSRLPVYQRSIGNAMRLLSDRVRYSLLLSDGAGNLLNSALWPGTIKLDAADIIARYQEDQRFELMGRPLFVRHLTIQTTAAARLELYLLRQDEAIRDEDALQIADVLRICINLWSQKHGEGVLPELVQAILRDEPFRMRRIADAFRIDVASIHNMWILSPLQKEGSAVQRGRDMHRVLSLIREELAPYCKTVVSDICDPDVVAFMDNPVDCDILALAASLQDSMAAAGIEALLTVCLNLKDTAQVRRAYLQNKNALTVARYIYPNKTVFTQQEIGFAETCQKLLDQGEAEANNCTASLDCLSPETGDLTETLTTYLLDSDMDTETCAEKLFLHRNTIKYRLNRINGRLGFKVGRMPETMDLYTAVAVRRILQARGKRGGFVKNDKE